MHRFKRTELSLKRILQRVVYSGKPPIVIYEPLQYISLSGNERILFLRQDRIGDVLVSIPTIKLLKSKYPNLRLDILMGGKNIITKSAIRKFFNNIYLYKKDLLNIVKLIVRMRKNHYDVVIDLIERASLTSAIFLRFFNVEYKIGFYNPTACNLYTHTVTSDTRLDQHIVERTASVLKVFGIDTANENLELEYDLGVEVVREMKEVTAINPDNFALGINLAGSSIARFWGTQNNIDFINQSTNKYKNLEVLIFAMPDYYQTADEIISKTKKAKLIKTASLAQYASAISLCNALLTPDTSAVQFAAALKVPCIALYNNYRKNAQCMPWFPYKEEQYSVEGLSDLMEDISISVVAERFEMIYDVYLLAKSNSLK